MGSADAPAAPGTTGSRPGRLLAALGNDGRSPAERWRLVRLMELFATLPPPPDPFGLYPRWRELQEAFVSSTSGSDGEEIEERFLELYCHLHGHEAPYTPDERAQVDGSGGYWCHAGGLAPILKAPSWLRDEHVSADYGAGNGLQLLLVQKLRSHRLSVQIEISGRMLVAGRLLQAWLGIPNRRVTWVQADVRSVPPDVFDFVYLYRPLKPSGVGLEFYREFAASLQDSRREVVVFSVADCLGAHLSADFEVIHSDGQLTCFAAGACRERSGGSCRRIGRIGGASDG